MAEDQPTPKASKTFHNVEAAALPATPLSSEGKMDSDIEDFNSVASSDAFDDDVVVHPGHGVSTTLGAERPHLPEWAERGW